MVFPSHCSLSQHHCRPRNPFGGLRRFAGFQGPVWAPQDLGLFAKYGFNADLVLVPGSVLQIQAITGGRIHFAQIDAATEVNAINQGLDLVMISGTLFFSLVKFSSL